MSKGIGGPEDYTGFQGKWGTSPRVAAQWDGDSYFRGNRFQVEISRSKVETPDVDLWLQHMCTCPHI